MSNLYEYDNETYYNLDEFKEANTLFENFLSRCTVIENQKTEQSKFNVSTMTITTNFCDEINVKMVFQRLLLDEDIEYIEEGKTSIRGVRTKNKKKYKKKGNKQKSNDKRKLGKGSPFSNQISIGFLCNDCTHVHNNPICVKIFKNGKVQMTGCKNIKEVERVYNQLYNKISVIKTEYIFNGNKVTMNLIKNIKQFKDVVIKTEMINGTFKTNYKIDLNKLRNKLNEVYTEDSIFINSEKKTSMICYLKKFQVFDEKKKKNKTPSMFVYNSGSINIISINLGLLMKSYEFARDFFDTYYEDLVEINMKHDETYFD